MLLNLFRVYIGFMTMIEVSTQTADKNSYSPASKSPVSKLSEDTRLAPTEGQVLSEGRVLTEDGMTLIEVIAVIVLITLIAVAVGKNVFKTASAGKAKLNVTQMNTLKGYLGQYKLQYNS